MTATKSQLKQVYPSQAIWIFFILLLIGCSSKKKQSGMVSLEDVKLSTLSGERIDMDEFENKTVFINFWATWCGPCIKEMPTIASAQAMLNDKDVVFLMASNEDADIIQRFSKKLTYDFRYAKLENMEDLKILALPTTFIFDPSGQLKFSESGYRMWDEPANIDLISKIQNQREE
jgi:thiol-disulfide isomerase/thioredoxin